MSTEKSVTEINTNRRAALGTLTKLGLGSAALGLMGNSALAAPAKNIDAAVLNFALNLEYLEAAFYLAAVGRLAELRVLGGNAEIILPAGLDPKVGMTFQDKNVKAYVQEIAGDELAHLIALRIGGQLAHQHEVGLLLLDQLHEHPRHHFGVELLVIRLDEDGAIGAHRERRT